LRGNARWELGKEADAAEDYYAAVNSDPECALAHHCIGSMLVSEGHNLSEAIRELHLAVELQPQLMVAHLQLAAVHTQLEEHDMAAACLTTCIEQAEDDPQKLCATSFRRLVHLLSCLHLIACCCSVGQVCCILSTRGCLCASRSAAASSGTVRLHGRAAL
jgi:tetratricopeptide (TPR) repeat protein